MVAEVKINNRQLKSVISKLERTKKAITGTRIMNTILLKVKSNILLRTNAGKDVNFNYFQGYNPEYAAIEGKTIVNLTRTGAMLNSMTQKTLSATKGIIFFLSTGYPGSDLTTRDIAKMHNIGDGVPKREFFGVSAMDDKLALKEYQKAIKSARKRVGI